MKKLLSLFILLFLFTGFTYGQLTVKQSNSTTNKLQDIVQSLVGNGVTVSNITSNYPLGSPLYGTFDEPSGGLGIKKGLLMTTGDVMNALGPNNTSSAMTAWGASGDQQLNELTGDSTNDACVIEFDITTASTQISFNYIFGSEEYPSFVDVGYNDVFAFFLSGPGITGSKNIALLPNSNTAVSIDNVNDHDNSVYYHDNGTGENGDGGTLIQYNGYTVKLRAEADVLPCYTYHLKLAIADGYDDLYDSGVFIESGSLTGTGEILFNGSLAPDTSHTCANALPATLRAGTNLLPNYLWTKDGVQAGTDQTLVINAEGWYKVKAYNGSCYWYDSIKIETDPDFSIVMNHDTTICLGDSASLSVVPAGSSGYTYSWSPAGSLSNSSIAAPRAGPLSTTTYTVSVTAGLCQHQGSTTVSIVPLINLQTDTAVNACNGTAIQLQASGASNYQWSPSTGLSNSSIANPTATLTNSAVFKLVGYNSCYKDSLPVRITVYDYPTTLAHGDTLICYEGTARLTADPSAYQYSWSPITGLSNPLSANPLASPTASTDYTLTVSNNGCEKTSSVQVRVKDRIVAQIEKPAQYIQVPGKLHLGNLSRGANQYAWYVTGFDSLRTFDLDLDVKQEEYYRIVLKATNELGCQAFDSVSFTGYKLFIPNLITPNKDGHNDRFEITGTGKQFTLEVYNRWGDRVYWKTEYTNEWEGEGLTDGIYYYFVHDSFLNKDYRGWVELISAQ
ncbi:MAG TPA: choice-of-anchor L domain-containing protein [Cytophagaceae bacterium]|nr:choice-of-anchor L domain-containing protein [Cytophagaceae bacterium]